MAQTVHTVNDGWCSDGKYTRRTEIKRGFAEDGIGFSVVESYIDDDGQSGSDSKRIENGRDIINFVRENKHSEMFDDVRDVVNIL